MTTNITKLKRSKGAPPPADVTPDVIADDTRTEKVELKPLQVRIPKAVFEEFSEQAGREFGFSHGSKKQLFLRMWQAYKAQNM
ncbi:hypothetical protein GGR95_003753 [Sulfitobacter undariae]|uniref:BrnA antitoxin of type II toxin-antitoxin system n=1 Tax=Sulfitobacter undariae TaxID=1563671 RepID=A0A7W6E7D0_9RHOB|nr:hypothetical protein [Sulfitobacter undariae]MBB3996085.1 hypothetical protein [Sulfitobacter undariae]